MSQAFVSLLTCSSWLLIHASHQATFHLMVTPPDPQNAEELLQAAHHEPLKTGEILKPEAASVLKADS